MRRYFAIFPVTRGRAAERQAMNKLLAILALAACTAPAESQLSQSLATYASSAAGGGTSGTGDRTVSITPAAGTLLVACASLSGNTQTTPTMTDSQGGSYSLLARAAWSSSANNAVCFARTALVASAVSHTLTLDTDTNTAGEITVVAFAGMDSASIRQVAYAANQTGTPSITFSEATLTSNLVLVAVASGDTTTTPPSGWTERRDVSQSTPTTALEVATRDSGFAGTTVTWGAAQSGSFSAIGVELDGPVPPPPPDAGPDAAPTAFAHGLAYQLYAHSDQPTHLAINTSATGSTLIVFAGGKSSDIDNGLTDGFSNTWGLVGIHDFTNWSGYGWSVQKAVNATGGSPHNFTQAMTAWDESTIVAVEVQSASSATVTSTFTQNANDCCWQPNSPTSISASAITTTGPATLIAAWAGAAPTGWGNFVATPDNGFTVIEALTIDDPSGEMPITVAYKTVNGAGTYGMGWTYGTPQGGQAWLVAVQP